MNHSDHSRLYSRLIAGYAPGLDGEFDPVLIPLEIMDAITSVCLGWTGYTHQWSKPAYAQYSRYLMASVDTESEASNAVALGWRYFRVRPAGRNMVSGEISCPASDEAGKKTTRERCKLCSGSRGAHDARKNITIVVHGKGSSSFVALDSIR